MEITLAKREKIKIPILITGASGSGKTASSLIMAKGIIEKMFPKLSEEDQWKKIAIIDTEHERAKYYVNSEIAGVHIGEFYHGNFEPPYTVLSLEQGINDSKQKGVEVIILDSLSHLWSGKGGIQDQVDEAGKRYKGIMAWNQVKPNIDELLHVLTANSVYIISTARSKTSYDMETNDKGKVVPIKIGLKPEIREGWDYEFAINFNINQAHVAKATKDNTNLFDEDMPITKETGYRIYEWSSEGIDPEEERHNLITKVKELGDLDESNRKMIISGEKKVGIKLEDWNRSQLRSAMNHLKQFDNVSSKPNEESNLEEIPDPSNENSKPLDMSEQFEKTQK